MEAYKIGKKLKQLRGKRTQSEIAKLAKCSRASYCHYENDRVEPNLYMLVVLADIYQVTLDELLGR